MNEIAVKACRKVNDSNNLFSTGGIGGSEYTEFKIGETYELPDPEKLKLCNYGFHYFRKEDLCFGIDLFEEETVFIEIEVLGEVVFDTYKRCTNKFKTLRYIPKKEWKKLIKENDNSGNCNSGNYNSGNNNSGNDNSGNCNSGYYNSGNRNYGDSNSGHDNSGNNNSGNDNSGNRNTGYYNSGHFNSGNYNSGNRNSGNCNSGNYNSGSYNSGNFNSGRWNSGNGYLNSFCKQTKYFLFDQEVSKISYENFTRLFYNFEMSWFSLEDKSYEEAWKSCPKKLLRKIKRHRLLKSKKNKRIFKEITGIDPDKIKEE
jgi:hypothetical protein